MIKTLLFTLSFILLHGFLIQAQVPVLEPLKVSQIRGINVYGKPVDNQTRCIHWHSELDIIAIKFKCCDKYYPCFSCHEEEADHNHQVWPKSEFDQKAILCGVCGNELGINEYMNSNNSCPHCQAKFNPGCSKHYHLYFETEPKKED
ncbi:CHY zinc finger protein [Algoriphagus sp.]|uniref:CHY zinc finger protein n=1 Tax=Algoriphagus sp. TaxID=1872435 RepID=UPI00262C0895|nr:CHY zinc finger protein [Algoriphagus sp.]